MPVGCTNDTGGQGLRHSRSLCHPSREAVAARWQRWVAVRDAPFPGHPWRYPAQMLKYLYTGRRSCLLPPRRLRGSVSAHF